MHTELTPRRELALLLTLAGIQFTHVVDFMIMMPLGPQLTTLFSISDAQFGLLVSAYTFAAGISGLLAASFVVRFERKRLVLVLYFLFALTTLGCAMAPTYGMLMLARTAAGVFGGILSAMTQTVIGDVIPRKISALTDVLTLLRFGAQKGFFWAAVRGLFRTFFSDYRRLRQSLGLTRYDAAEILAKLEQAGFSAEPAPSNIGHNESRNSFLAHAR